MCKNTISCRLLWQTRSTFAGTVGASFTSLPWGDGYNATVNLSAGDQDNEHFAGLEQDNNNSNVPMSGHAQFRQYSLLQGNWLSPDPYLGSNPQSLNRHSYALNNPSSLLDPSGLDYAYDCGDGCVGVVGTPGPTVCDIIPYWCSDYNWGDGSDWGTYSGSGDGSTGAGGSSPSSGTSHIAILSNATNNGIVSKICSAIPSGSTIGVSGGVGGLGSVGGGAEIVMNYNSRQVSVFGIGGVQAGWNGGASGSIYAGPVYGLNSTNSNYSGGFTGVNGGAGLGGFIASSSGGLTGGGSGLAVHPSAPGVVTAFGGSIGGGVLGGFSGGVTATSYSNPFQLGKFAGFGVADYLLYAVRQVCK